MKKRSLAMLMLAAFAVTACGGGRSSNSTQDTPINPTAPSTSVNPTTPEKNAARNALYTK